MFQLDLPLLAYLESCQAPSAYFFLGNETPAIAELLPQPNVCFESVDKDRDWQPRWTDSAFWDDRQNFLRVRDRGAVAIFDAPFWRIPKPGLEALQAQGFHQLLFRVGSEWRITSLRGKAPLLLLRTFSEIAEIIRRGALTYKTKQRAKILDRYASDLLLEAGASLKHESQYAFTCYVPRLLPYADSAQGNGSGILFFEDESLLLPHSAHADIRELGKGRVSLWNDNLYFSASDNSDPRSNGRRYRYLIINEDNAQLRKELIALSSDLSDTLGNPRSENPESRGEILLELGSRRLPKSTAAQFEQEISSGRDLVETDANPNSVSLFITNLGPGGAERQMTGLASQLVQRGCSVNVLTYQQSAPETLHYKPVLEAQGIAVDFINREHPQFNLRKCVRQRGYRDLQLIASLPIELAAEVWHVYTHLFVSRPTILHCWLDQSNLVGAIAGWIAGVPRIVLSSRSVNPAHFPHIYRPWYRKWYGIVSRCSRVEWSANSKVGATSYAEWIGIDPSRFRIIPNGLDFSALKVPAQSEVAQLRSRLNIPQHAPVICGVLRLSHEKRPLRFIRLIWEAKKHFPELHAVLVGVGPLEQQVRREVSNLKLTECLHLLGRQSDVPLIMGAADLIVLTSSVEAFPNVLIEAAWVSRPVVSTDVGSVAEVVDHGSTGYVCARDNFSSVLNSTLALLADPSLRSRFGKVARSRVESLYSMEQMTEQFLQFYGITPTAEASRKLCA